MSGPMSYQVDIWSGGIWNIHINQIQNSVERHLLQKAELPVQGESSCHPILPIIIPAGNVGSDKLEPVKTS